MVISRKWTSDVDIAAALSSIDVQVETHHVAFSEHKVNGKSKGCARYKILLRSGNRLTRPLTALAVWPTLNWRVMNQLDSSSDGSIPSLSTTISRTSRR